MTNRIKITYFKNDKEYCSRSVPKRLYDKHKMREYLIKCEERMFGNKLPGGDLFYNVVLFPMCNKIKLMFNKLLNIDKNVTINNGCACPCHKSRTGICIICYKQKCSN